MATKKTKKATGTRTGTSNRGGKTTGARSASTAAKKKSGSTSTGTGAKRSASANRSKSGSNSRKQTTVQKKKVKPIRREITGGIFLLLAIFAAFGYFDAAGGFLILKYCSFLKGLLGYGFWITPPALLLAGGVLLTHKGYPVCARTICALLLPVLGGGMIHVILCKQVIALHLQMFSALWTSGMGMTSGGALAGCLAVWLDAGLSSVGAVILYVLAIIACIMAIFRCTPADLLGKMRSAMGNAREHVASRPAYDPEDYYDAYEDNTYEEEYYPENVPQRHTRRNRGFDVDVVLAGETRPTPQEKQEEELFDSTPGVRPPHEFLQDEMQKTSKAKKQSKKKIQGKTTDLDFSDTLKQVQDPEPPKAAEAVEEPEPEMDNAPETMQPLEAEVQSKSIEQELPYSEMPDKQPDDEDADVADVIESEQEETPEEVSDSTDELDFAANEVAEDEPEVSGHFVMSASASAVAAALANDRSRAEEKADILTQQVPSPVTTAGLQHTDEYQYPPVQLLDATTVSAAGDDRDEVESTRELLDDTVRSFGINAPVINVTRGPSVTRYELELPRGVKLSKLTNLAGDIALSLGASSVRIAPITGRNSVVGVEVPNRVVTAVPIREVIDSREFRTHASKVAFAVGKDISGRNIVGNIAKLPHMLIAGTTGSGKSVCTNSLIISLLYKSGPEDVRFIMVDPKMVELGIYNGIPHLLIPVVTDPKKAAGALQWAVTEMLKRYSLFNEVGVRDLKAYNAHILQDGGEKLPQIVVVIDELADLMMVAAKDVEESINRVAQMGRAAGMHLVIATQRPSADVITGLMKANIPSRIAFAVSSTMESRIILDTGGAEKLVGKGDMLYAPLGNGKPLRVQGCMITDEEVARVVNFIKQNSTENYDDSIMEEVESNAQQAEKSGKGKNNSNNVSTPANAPSTEGSAEEADELLRPAIDVVVETGMASVSMLQRRLKLGYARAARLVDQMEARGIVGVYQGSKPREVLITREEWQAIKQGDSLTMTESPEDDEYAAALAMSQAADAEMDEELDHFEGEGDDAPF